MADHQYDLIDKMIAGGAAVLAMMGTAFGGAKMGHRRGSEERRENDSAMREDIDEIKTSLSKLDEKQDRQARETHTRIDQILLLLGERK